MVLFDFFFVVSQFSFFFLCFWMFFCLSLTISSDFCVACIFLKKFYFSFLRRALCSTWKNSSLNNSFNKKAVVKISIITSLKSPLWNFVKFRSGFFLINVSVPELVSHFLVCCIILVLIRINGNTIKTPGFYDNLHLLICSICLILDLFSLTEVR